MKKITVFVGTRPEAIKVVSVVHALRTKSERFKVCLCATGQHREMLDHTLSDFNLKPDVSLKVMTNNQTLASLSSKLFKAIDQLLDEERPDVVLVQGDTTTVQVATQCAYYRQIPVGHIEAGLRSYNIMSPFPEEFNRRVVSLLSMWHFAPTAFAGKNLLSEGVPEDNIKITGNTVVDALLWMTAKVRSEHPALPSSVERIISEQRRIVVVTGHRRESFGQGFNNICKALLELSQAFPDVRFVYPLHLNPNVRDIVKEKLTGVKGILLIGPLSYKPFVRLMDESYLILTDSGGIQEEGPSLGKPVLVMRDVTERPEGVTAGVNILVGTDANRIFYNVSALLNDDAAYQRTARIKNPYGDGKAGQQITDFLADRLL
jgi:UDP-N-acetylglucosamine 2-epimerase